MISPSISCQNIPQASARTLAPFSSPAIRIVSAAVTLVVSAALLAAGEPERSAQSGDGTHLTGVTGQPSTVPERRASLDSAEIVDLQRQVNEIRSDLLDERERRIGRLQESNGAVLVVLGFLIGVGGLWAYAKLRAIASEARIGAAAARALVTMQPNLIPQPLALPAETGAPPHRVLGLRRPSVGTDERPAHGLGRAIGSPAEPAASNGHRAGHAPVYEPAPGPGSDLRLLQDRSAPDLDLGADDAELQRYEDVTADCAEAIRLSPDDPRLYLERGNALCGLQRYEAALAAYDRAILLDPDNAAAYLGRCRARSELGLHEEAVEDYERLVRLDPEAADASAGV